MEAALFLCMYRAQKTEDEAKEKEREEEKKARQRWGDGANDAIITL